jgi:hypothetical protein
MSNYSPILIGTLDRSEHFINLINSLKIATDVELTDLYIALDFPFKDIQKDGYNKIKCFISEISCFKSITIFQREKNFGIYKNYTEAINSVFQNHETIIILEDDNVVSRNFLQYMNGCLEKFEHNKEIYAVCGWKPIDEIDIFENEQTIFFSKTFCGWGAAYWKSKYISDEILYNNNFMKLSLKSLIKIDNSNNQIFPLLYTMYNKKIIFGDTLVVLYQHFYNKFSIFPVISKVRNLGHDGTGVNSKLDHSGFYSSKSIDDRDFYKLSEVDSILEINENNKIANLLKRGYKTSLINRIFWNFKILIYKCFY